jgi:tRNA(fMet)-specific endonuclease VapC
MRLAGRQLVLDTNVLVHLIRGSQPGELLETIYGIRDRRPRAIVPIVVKGEIKSLALRLNWGDKKRAELSTLLSQLPTADISSEIVLDAYSVIDAESARRGRKMGKNDAWIAAIAKVQGATVLTTDQDFSHLHPDLVEIEYVDSARLAQGQI